MKIGLVLASAAALALGSATAHAAVTIADSSFESPRVGSYQYDPTVTGVTFAGNAGIQANGSGWHYANAPDGTQTAYLQDAGQASTITMDVSGLIIGGTYEVNFYASQRPGHIPMGVQVSFDSTQLGTVTPTTDTWLQYSAPLDFTASATTGALTFHTDKEGPDRDIGIDAVSIATIAAPEPATWAMMLLGMFGLGAVLRNRRKLILAAV